MQNPLLDHPTEDELERFLLDRSPEEELELVETHVLACDSCVARLEALEIEISDMKMASTQLQLEAKQNEIRKVGFRKKWLTVPIMSWAAAAAFLAIGVALIPQVVHHSPQSVAEVSLSSYRGLETRVIPLHRPLHIRVNARYLAKGAVRAQIVNGGGSEIWKGTVEVNKDAAELYVPGFEQSGTYFLRLLAPANAGGELLREFAFQAK